MKAVLCSRFGTAEDLELKDIPPPQAGPGEAVVQVKAAALNFFDTLIIAGKYQYKPPFPFSPAAEFAGIVESVGDGVTEFAPGDRVMGHMGWGAAREAVALFDQSSFSKLEVLGPGALAFLEGLCGNRIDRPVGTVVYTQLLNHRGGIEADLSVMRRGEDRFMLVTGTAFGQHDLAWIRQHAPDDGSVQVEDETSAYACFGVWGPNARTILQPLTTADLSNEAFPYMRAQELAVGRIPCPRGAAGLRGRDRFRRLGPAVLRPAPGRAAPVPRARRGRAPGRGHARRPAHAHQARQDGPVLRVRDPGDGPAGRRGHRGRRGARVPFLRRA